MKPIAYFLLIQPKKSTFPIALFLLTCLLFAKEARCSNDSLDVIKYTVWLQPDINDGSIEGSSMIDFHLDPQVTEVIFDCGALTIKKVTGKIKGYEQKGQKLFIYLPERATVQNQVSIFYEGSPKKGLLFDAAAQQMYTVFHTSEWMVCRDEVADKALIDLGIVIPDSLQAVASGELFMKAPYKEGLDSYLWVQSYATSPYTYGFAIGNFQTLSRSYKTTQLNYLSPQYGLDLDLIFWETPKIMAFLEEISGVAYYQSTYTQVLMGAHYQEMAGMVVLKGSYGKHIIDNETEINLITHELAHQWWGNRITCQSWNHFWLNEAFATFLSAAYNEQAFGKEKYLEDIEVYRQIYLKVRDKGKDKPLVFESWHNPTRDDRDIVYFKGAYVLHLLRETLGEAHFWEGLKAYSQKYFDKFVVTKNFQEEMERVSGKDLQSFFDRWVY